MSRREPQQRIRIVPSLDMMIAINAEITDMDEAIVRSSVKVGLLDSALHAPLAGYGDVDIFPFDHQRLAVICARIVLNHPFIDGNKRCGFVAILETAFLNDVDVEFDDLDEISDQIESLAAGTLDEVQFGEWLLRSGSIKP